MIAGNDETGFMIISKETEKQVQLLLSLKKKVLAVKFIRDQTGCSLSQAKDFVDHFQRTEPVAGKNSPGDLEHLLINLMQHGKKVEAVKLYKDATGAGLSDSIIYVEELTSSSKIDRDLETRHQTFKTQSFSSRETELQKIIASHEPSTKSGLWKMILAIAFIALLVYILFNLR